jgi:hypothetical protein
MKFTPPAWLGPVVIVALGAALPTLTSLASSMPAGVKSSLVSALVAVLAAELRVFMQPKPVTQDPVKPSTPTPGAPSA